MFQNNQKVVVVSSGDERRVIKVQSASGTPDPSRYPIVDTTGVSGRDQSVQIVSGGDPTRFPILRGVSDARATADSVITALSPAAWYRNATDVISSGGFASIWADYASSDKGLVLPGVAGNYASIPANAYLEPSNKVSLRARLVLPDWTPASSCSVCGQYSGGNPLVDGPMLYIVGTTGRLGYVCADNAGNALTATSSASPTVSDGDALWIRVDHDNAAATVKFYTAPDSQTAPADGDWTQLGTTQTIATFGAFNVGATQLFQVGAFGTGGSVFVHQSQIYRCIDIVDGTTVFDADFSAQAIGTASFTESSSNAATVTINTSGARPAHIGKARDLLQVTGTNQPAYSAGVMTGDGADNFMRTGAFTLNQPSTVVAIMRQDAWTSGDSLWDGAGALNTRRLYQDGITPNFAMYAGGAGPASSSATLTTWRVVKAFYSGASSTLNVDNGADATGNAGTSAASGLTLFADGQATPAQYGRVSYAEVVLISGEISAGDWTSLYSALDALRDAL